MKYDFTSILDRRGLDAIAVAPEEDPYGIAPRGNIKEGFDLIPMWVADMNFPTAPAICELVIQRAEHPAFGYFNLRPEYFDSICRWQETRNHVTGLEPKHIGYQNGVLGGVLSALKVLCSDGDNVLVHAPTYVGFLEEVGRGWYLADGLLGHGPEDQEVSYPYSDLLFATQSDGPRLDPGRVGKGVRCIPRKRCLCDFR